MLNNFELIEYCKNNNILLNDIFQSDEVKNINLKQKKFFYIINQESSKLGNGSHWIVLCKLDRYYYYDSFGCPPLQVILNKLKGIKIGFTNFSHQPIKSTECGFYCCLFLKLMQENKYKNTEKTFNKYIDYYGPFNDVDNDKIMFDLLK